MLKIYGIKQCSTMQKAFAWLQAHDMEYEFHDYKKCGIDAATLEQWCSLIPWQKLLNTRGTSWRKLSEADRENIDQVKAIQLMAKTPSLIKRPLILGGREPVLGFEEALYADILETPNA